MNVAKKLLAAPSARYHCVPVRSIALPVWPPKYWSPQNIVRSATTPPVDALITAETSPPLSPATLLTSTVVRPYGNSEYCRWIGAFGAVRRKVTFTSAGVESGLARAIRSAKKPVAPSGSVQVFDRRGCVPFWYSTRFVTPSASSSALGFDRPYLASQASARPLLLASVAAGIVLVTRTGPV